MRAMTGSGLRLQKSPQFADRLRSSATRRSFATSRQCSAMPAWKCSISWRSTSGPRIAVEDFKPALETGGRIRRPLCADAERRCRLGPDVRQYWIDSATWPRRYGLTPIIEFVPNRAARRRSRRALQLAHDIGRDRRCRFSIDPLHLMRSGRHSRPISKRSTQATFPMRRCPDGMLARGRAQSRAGEKNRRSVDGGCPAMEPCRCGKFSTRCRRTSTSASRSSWSGPGDYATAWAKEGLDRTKAFLAPRSAALERRTPL